MNLGYHNMMFNGADFLGVGGSFPDLFVILPFVAWALIWKGWALYLAARRGETAWFIALLLINTMGLLEIFYIFAIAKRKDRKD